MSQLLCPARSVSLFGHEVELPPIPSTQSWCVAVDPTGATPSYVDCIAPDDYERENWREQWEAGVDANGNPRPDHFSNLIIFAEDFQTAGDASDSPESTKHDLADQILRDCDGAIRFRFEPGMILDYDFSPEGSKGHIWWGMLEEAPTDEHPRSLALIVDDRKGDVRTLLAAECRRVANIFETLAQSVERKGSSR